MDLYIYLNFQDQKERERNEEKMKNSKHPSLISALDRKKQSMKIAMIEPSSTSGLSSKKVSEFKLDMSQFNVMDLVDLFKQTSELIFLDLVNVSISKEKTSK